MIHIHKHSLIFSVLTLVSRCFRWSFREGPTTTLNWTRASSPLSNTPSSEWAYRACWSGVEEQGAKRGEGKDGSGETASQRRKKQDRTFNIRRQPTNPEFKKQPLMQDM